MTDDPWLLVAGHRDRLLRLARRRTPSRQDAEDVVGEALLRVATYPGLDPERAGALLTAVVVRLCVDADRRRGVERRAMPRLHLPADEPVATLLDEAEARWLASAALTGVEAAVLAARADGVMPRDAAAVLGITPGAAKSALERARRKLLAAWRATLGTLGALRLRRLLVPAAGVVVAAGLVLGLSARREVVVPAATPGAYVAVDLPEAVRRAVPGRAAMPTVATRHASSVTRSPSAAIPDGRTAVTIPATTAGPVSQDGLVVLLDLRERPADRLARCLANGVDLDPGSASAVCR